MDKSQSAGQSTGFLISTRCDASDGHRGRKVTLLSVMMQTKQSWLLAFDPTLSSRELQGRSDDLKALAYTMDLHA